MEKQHGTERSTPFSLYSSPNTKLNQEDQIKVYSMFLCQTLFDFPELFCVFGDEYRAQETAEQEACWLGKVLFHDCIFLSIMKFS